MRGPMAQFSAGRRVIPESQFADIRILVIVGESPPANRLFDETICLDLNLLQLRRS